MGEIKSKYASKSDARLDARQHAAAHCKTSRAELHRKWKKTLIGGCCRCTAPPQAWTKQHDRITTTRHERAYYTLLRASSRDVDGSSDANNQPAAALGTRSDLRCARPPHHHTLPSPPCPHCTSTHGAGRRHSEPPPPARRRPAAT